MDLKERLAKVVTVADAEKQLELATDYAKRLRAKAKAASTGASTLAEKIAIKEKVNQAELVVRQMRRMVFDIEDAIAAGKTAASLVCN